MKYRKKYYLQQKVEFEDCDLQGIVHHPKILCFLERARLQALNEENIGYKKMLEKKICFVISDINIRFSFPLKLDDVFWITTEVIKTYKNYIKIYQTICFEKILDDPMNEKHPVSFCKIRLCLVNIEDLSPIHEDHEIFKELNYDKEKTTKQRKKL